MSNTPNPPNQLFEDYGNFAGLWKHRSDDLFDAASIVWHTQGVGVHKDGKVEPVLHYHRPAYLLMGLCLEGLLKGLLVARNPLLVGQGKLDGSLKTHDLAKLLSAAKILFKKEEEDLINRLTTSVVWMSKYPIPTAAGSPASTGQQWGEQFGYRDDDFGRFMTLRDRVLEEYKSIKYVQILRYTGPLILSRQPPLAGNPASLAPTAPASTDSPTTSS